MEDVVATTVWLLAAFEDVVPSFSFLLPAPEEQFPISVIVAVTELALNSNPDGTFKIILPLAICPSSPSVIIGPARLV